ncbi:MAG: RdgB/HAM1 family non-canonical purine NTP pyrophosphatase [Actinomycetes bacterium]
MAPLPDRIVLASANPKKVAEIREILADAFGDAVELVPRPDEVPEVVEDAPDFVGNARLKAVALCAATGLAALADDSGLEVDALGGEPGVRSARYAGEDATDAENVDLLLAELLRQGATDRDERAARFRCVLVLRYPDGREVVAKGHVEGWISGARHGANGFGYDPVFVPSEGTGRTFAQMSTEKKHAISHRGRALAALVAKLGRGLTSS